MKRLVTLAILAGLLLWEIPLPAQDQAPPSAQTPPPDQSGPSPQPQTEPPPASSQTPEPASPQSQVPPAGQASPTPTPPKKKKPRTKGPASGHKVVVRNGGAKDQSAQLAPGMSKEQELHSRETTANLLATTDANLKSVAGRRLTPAQQSVLDQIHTYIRQSKEASDSGDVARARTLAYKAHLLSDELRK